MNEKLKIVRTESFLGELPVIIEIDDYVPCRVRTYAAPIGGYYLRIGNFKTSLLELIVDPASRVVRGLTLTCFDKVIPMPKLSGVAKVGGLPVLTTLETESRRTDIKNEINVSLDHGLTVFWGDIQDAEELIEMQGLGFYLKDGALVGCQVTGLTEKQLAMIEAQCSPKTPTSH